MNAPRDQEVSFGWLSLVPYGRMSSTLRLRRETEGKHGQQDLAAVVALQFRPRCLLWPNGGEHLGRIHRRVRAWGTHEPHAMGSRGNSLWHGRSALAAVPHKKGLALDRL